MNVNDLRQSSYVPYSGNRAACIAESNRGSFFPGVRIENAVFPLTISEVQAALFNCLSEGERPKVLYSRAPDDDHLNFWKEEYELTVLPFEELDQVAFKEPAITGQRISETDTLEALLDRAITLNSNFQVSALLKTDQGIFTGVNIECTEWSMGLCAERVALAKALSYGVQTFDALYVHTRYGEYSSPCGACRQVIIEHMPHQPVHLYHANHTHSVHYSSDLLPYSFRSSKLKQH